MKKQFKAPRQHLAVNKILALGLIIGGTLLFNGCQIIQQTARDFRSGIDETVQSTKDKANSLKEGISQTANDVTQKVGETKSAIDNKVQQVQEAGNKIQQAQEAVKQANEAVSNLTK